VSYRVDAHVSLPLGFAALELWQKPGVGMAVASYHDYREASGQTVRAFELFSISDPDRAQGFDRCGFFREALALSARDYEPALAESILARYLELLPDELDSPAFRVLPGAAETLQELRGRGAALGLCTGNLARGARLKLRHAGLDGYFDWSPAGLHGFGEDGEARARLVATAVARVAAALGRAVPPAQVLVIGDTPRDVLAAREVGCAVLCVATGNFDAAALWACRPDAVAESLQHSEARRLLGLEA
jgi:phosphoglycolate phosphatase-like HAD superfamily hydrolase